MSSLNNVSPGTSLKSRKPKAHGDSLKLRLPGLAPKVESFELYFLKYALSIGFLNRFFVSKKYLKYAFAQRKIAVVDLFFPFNCFFSTKKLFPRMVKRYPFITGVMFILFLNLFQHSFWKKNKTLPSTKQVFS